jgi:hypothetical protein
MAKRIQDGKLLYHVTAVENLENIFKNNLLSREDALSKNLLKVDIANSEIILKRKELNILNYIPFHFFEPTAFTGTIFNNNPDKSFCSITILRTFAKEQNFKICTAHPLSIEPLPQIFDYEVGFNSINWYKAEERNYNDSISKNACMAECLAVSPVKTEDFFSIYVANDDTKNYVEHIASKILGNYMFYIDVNKSFSKARI